MREMIVQNGFGVVPSVSDGIVQNEGMVCPKWAGRVSRKSEMLKTRPSSLHTTG